MFLIALVGGGCSDSSTTEVPPTEVPPTHDTDVLSIAAFDGEPADDEGEPVCEIDESYDPVIDPARFVTTIDNPLFPLKPGTTFLYHQDDEIIEVVVTRDHKMILGVSTTVVRDVVSVDGEVVEDTLDFYAQDVDGAVWYFGEDTKTLDGGQVVSTEGSWEAGVDDAKPGLIIPAKLEIGLQYRQEYAPCEAEDRGEIVSTCTDVDVSYGQFSRCLQTLDTTPLDPSVAEHKYYCPNVGLALAVDLVTGEREELVQVTPP